MDAKTMGERAVSRLRTALTSNAALVLAVLTLTGCATRFTQRGSSSEPR